MNYELKGFQQEPPSNGWWIAEAYIIALVAVVLILIFRVKGGLVSRWTSSLR